MPPKIHLWQGLRQSFGQSGHPQRWVNILGRVEASSGLYDLRWWLGENRGRFFPLSIGPTPYRLNGLGDFNIEIDRARLKPGRQTITIEAIDQTTESTQTTVELFYDPAGEAPFPLVFDPADSATPAPFQIVDGRWGRTAEGLRVGEPGYDRIVAFGDMHWRDYRIEATVTFHRFSDDPRHHERANNGAWAGFVCHWQGHYDWGDLIPRRGWHPYGVIANCELEPGRQEPRRRLMGNQFQKIQIDESGRSIALDTPHRFVVEARSNTDGPNHYQMKVWPAAEPEPATWDLAGEGFPEELKAGSVCFAAHNCDATLGSVSVSSLP